MRAASSDLSLCGLRKTKWPWRPNDEEQDRSVFVEDECGELEMAWRYDVSVPPAESGIRSLGAEMPTDCVPYNNHIMTMK